MFKILLISVFAILITSCNSKAEKQQNSDLTSQLQASFKTIYLTRFSKDYPRSDAYLDNCEKYNNEKCLELYNQVKETKKAILSLPPEQALIETLNIIESACTSEDSDIANSVCYGGLMSLYFYDSKEQDELIFERIKEYPVEVKNIAFHYNFFWFNNRPEPQKWIDYISTLDIDWQWDTGVQKKAVIDRFGKNIDDVIDDLPWMLVN